MLLYAAFQLPLQYRGINSACLPFAPFHDPRSLTIRPLPTEAIKGAPIPPFLSRSAQLVQTVDLPARVRSSQRHYESPSHHLHLPHRRIRCRCESRCSSCTIFLPWRPRSVFASSDIRAPNSINSVLTKTIQPSTGVCDIAGYTPTAKYGEACSKADCASGYECHTLERCPVSCSPHGFHLSGWLMYLFVRTDW